MVSQFEKYIEKSQENFVFKSITFCPIYLKDDEGEPFTKYNLNKIEQKREKESVKQLCDYLKKLKKLF